MELIKNPEQKKIYDLIKNYGPIDSSGLLEKMYGDEKTSTQLTAYRRNSVVKNISRMHLKGVNIQRGIPKGATNGRLYWVGDV